MDIADEEDEEGLFGKEMESLSRIQTALELVCREPMAWIAVANLSFMRFWYLASERPAAVESDVEFFAAFGDDYVVDWACLAV